MYNGEHEIKCPNDKYIKHFLWSDYFHDSKIQMIEFNNSKGNEKIFPDQIVLTIKSCRDIDNEWDRLNGTKIEKEIYITDNKNKYIYNLYFVDCKYFNYEKSIKVNDYINGRFKNTAILQKITKSTNKYYYHFRISTDDGYLDVIFSKFKIKKLIGRIYIKDTQIRNNEIKDYNINWLKKYDKGILLMENGELNKMKLLELMNSGDDVERYYALYYFMKYDNETVTDYARNIIRLDWDDYEMSKIMAISLIGNQGDRQDLPALLKEYFAVEERLSNDSTCYCSTLLPKRHIMDAIEKIKYRENQDYDLLL